MLGVNPNAEREKNDFYTTDPRALKLFIKKLEEDGIKLHDYIWEPACGMGHLSEVLKEKGHRVLSTDIVDSGYNYKNKDIGMTRPSMDFLEYDKDDEFRGDILTNPPFKLAEKFVEQGIELLEEGNRLYLFLKIQFLEGQKRKELFKKYPPKYVYVYSARQLCCKNGEFEKYTSTTQCYAWYVWEKGYKENITYLKWI